MTGHLLASVGVDFFRPELYPYRLARGSVVGSLGAILRSPFFR